MVHFILFKHSKQTFSNKSFQCHRCRQLRHHNISVFGDHMNLFHNIFFRNRGDFLHSKFRLQDYRLDLYSISCSYLHSNIYFLYSRCLHQRCKLLYHNKRSLGRFYNEYRHRNKTVKLCRTGGTSNTPFRHCVVKPRGHSNIQLNGHRYTYSCNIAPSSCHKSFYHNIFALRFDEPVLHNTYGLSYYTLFGHNIPYFHHSRLDFLCSKCECPSRKCLFHNKRFHHQFFRAHRHCNRSVWNDRTVGTNSIHEWLCRKEYHCTLVHNLESERILLQ